MSPLMALGQEIRKVYWVYSTDFELMEGGGSKFKQLRSPWPVRSTWDQWWLLAAPQMARRSGRPADHRCWPATRQAGHSSSERPDCTEARCHAKTGRRSTRHRSVARSEQSPTCSRRSAVSVHLQCCPRALRIGKSTGWGLTALSAHIGYIVPSKGLLQLQPIETKC